MISEDMFIGAMIERQNGDRDFNTAVAQIHKANAEIEKANRYIREQAQTINQLRSELESTKARADRLQLHFDVEQAHTAGLTAEIDKLNEMYGDSVLFTDSGQRFRDGTKKAKLHLIYEKAFDAKGRGLGMSDPTKYRKS
ncbi:hypothetical protein SAMN05216548_11440 [Faunimonas pinastri]|uniref:Uncharacterized protein n=1 Tax=Faunimonas pinastri TaxID=1855383 RepID=A0A1H9MT84_9HYPH|nr:hypothetical protein [Faunimonas pinastri]SER26926.1 hypothetical protein SAMN05216548_11440 [Faunimonas pinastri]